MNTEVKRNENNAEVAAYEQIPQDVITSLVLNGDLSKMTNEQKVDYYNHFCRSLKINPLTQPFEIINLKGKLRLYAKKDATDQLRRINGVSVTEVTTQKIDTLYIVTAKGMDRSGRVDVSTAALDLKGLSGESLANALMKCETKAKRRLTLSLCGLGILDELEVDSVEVSDTKQSVVTNRVSLDVLNPENEDDIKEFSDIKTMFESDLLPPAIEDRGKSFNVLETMESLTEEFANGTLTKEKASKWKKYISKMVDYFTKNPIDKEEVQQEDDNDF